MANFSNAGDFKNVFSLLALSHTGVQTDNLWKVGIATVDL